MPTLENWYKEKKIETPEPLQGWYNTQAIPETEPEKPWWESAWEKTKDFGEWLFPKGIQDLPRQYGAALQKGGMAAGEAMTWLARLLPGQEDLAPYAEQDTARQALTVAQAGATIAVATLAISQGVNTLSGLRNYFKQTTKLKIPTTTTGKWDVSKKTGLLEIKEPGKYVVEKFRAPTAVVVPKKEVGLQALKQLSQKVRVVETIQKSNFTNDLQKAIYNNILAKVGTDITPAQITNASQQISNQVLEFTPAQFTGEFAESLVALTNKPIEKAINVLKMGLEYTAPKREVIPEEEIVEREMVRPLTETPEEYAPPEIAPKAELGKELPPSLEQEINIGGGPVLGGGLELTDKEVFTEPKEKNAFQKAIDAVSKTFSVYTRVKKENPEAYRHFREFKGGQELAYINARQTNEEVWGKITQNEALAIQRAKQIPEEYPRSKLAPELQPALERLDKVLEDRKQQLIDMGKMKVGWPQSYINKLEKEKDKLLAEAELLSQKKAIQKRQSRITEIDELKEILSTREFFPAGYIERAENQPQILRLLPEGIYRNSQIRSKFRAGKIVPDIDTAIEWGLEPIDPRASLMDYLTWFELEKNKWVLYEGIKDNTNLAVRPIKDSPAPEYFVEPVGISELKGYKINPLVGEVLDEFNRSANFKGLAKAYARVARWGKVASFHNPIIMGGVYDPQQGYMAAGLGVLNPVTLVKSIKSVTAKDEFYKKCVAADLFPKPVDLGPQRDMDKFVLSVARQMDKDTPQFTAWVEKMTEGEWNFKGETNTQKMINATKGLFNMIWNTSWGLDAASRETTVKTLMARGWTFQDAVERARFYHADYGDIPADTRRFANYFMWTPSYQVSMAKVYGNMARHPIKERGPLARLIAFQLAVAGGMAVAGYTWQRGNRFVKDISKEEQDVISSPGPLYWLNKMLARNPLNSMYWQSAVPINIIWSIERNFDGLGSRVYDPKASQAMQVAQIAEFAIERYFRPLETARRLTDEERSLVNRLLSLVAITKYKRKTPREEKKKIERWWEYK